MRKRKIKIVPVRMTESMRAKAERRAEAEGVSLSEWIRKAISTRLEAGQ